MMDRRRVHTFLRQFFWILLLISFQVWVLDATPGNVRAGADGDDHPAELISFLSTLPKEVHCLLAEPIYFSFSLLFLHLICKTKELVYLPYFLFILNEYSYDCNFKFT